MIESSYVQSECGRVRSLLMVAGVVLFSLSATSMVAGAAQPYASGAHTHGGADYRDFARKRGRR